MIPAATTLSHLWALKKDIVYLNHGSFGATPIEVTNYQKQLMDELEAEPVAFNINKLPHLIKASKTALANFIGTSANNIFFVNNTTTGVNNIVQCLHQPNSHWLTTNHAYGACLNVVKHYAAANNNTLNIANIAYPNTTTESILEAIENTITPKTTFALIDYITSATAIILPIKKIIDLLHSKNILVLINAAHAPGMVNLNLDFLNADFFVANCHKWLCSPKGSAFVYVNPMHQHLIRPMVISHYNDLEEDTPAHWANNFEWDGTHDYSAFIAVKKAIEYMPTLHTQGWEGIKKHNHNLVWQAGNHIANTLNIALPFSQNMIGSILNIPMPNGEIPSHKFHYNTHLKNTLYNNYNIEVPIFNYPNAPTQWLRISAQLYNNIAQYQYLAACLKKVL